jgi:hypothetical protein
VRAATLARDSLETMPCLWGVPLASSSRSLENVRHYTTFNLIVFSVKYPRMEISSLSWILLVEVAVVAWYESAEGRSGRILYIVCVPCPPAAGPDS